MTNAKSMRAAAVSSEAMRAATKRPADAVALEIYRWLLDGVCEREHLAANMDRARADLKGAQAQFAKDIKGAQEMAGLAIVEKERALADMQLAQVFR